MDLTQELSHEQWLWTLTRNPTDNLLLNLKSENEYQTMCRAEIQCNSENEELNADQLAGFAEFESNHFDEVYNDILTVCCFEDENRQRIVFTQHAKHNPNTNHLDFCEFPIDNGGAYACSVKTFFRYLVWNLLRRVHLLRMFRVSCCTVQMHTFMNNVMKCVWGHYNVKPPRPDYAFNFDLYHNNTGLGYQVKTTTQSSDYNEYRIMSYKHIGEKLLRSFMLHTHARLGINSPAHNVLCLDVLETITRHLASIANVKLL